MEPGRYRLAVSRACPWANRAIIVRRLLGLEDALSMAVAGPTHDARSWTFDLDPGGRDPVLGIERLQEAYLARDPGYDRGVTVPALVEVPTGRVVTNDYPQLTLDLSTQWSAHHRPGAPDLYPQALRDEIDAVNEVVYTDVNNGVYEAGFDRLTEADVRLFTTLVRFDAVYHGHFTCNRAKLTEMPVLWGYARDLFQTPGFGDTVDVDQVKQRHGRDALGGRPFGDGAPPPPPPEDERVPAAHTPLR